MNFPFGRTTCFVPTRTRRTINFLFILGIVDTLSFPPFSLGKQKILERPEKKEDNVGEREEVSKRATEMNGTDDEGTVIKRPDKRTRRFN